MKFWYYANISYHQEAWFHKENGYLPVLRTEIAWRITLRYILLMKEYESLFPYRKLQTIRQNYILQLTVLVKALNPSSWFISMHICYPSYWRQFSTFLQLQINGNRARLSTKATTEIEISFYFISTYISILIHHAVPQAHRFTPGIWITLQMVYCITVLTSDISIHILWQYWSAFRVSEVAELCKIFFRVCFVQFLASS
jgi:hypothetical protein